ncbi:hypothetical protein GCM10010267_06050 [Streptomyces griseorubens]|nr:hypothetical protein GCM10010267_06050 [Streptomyces griseorubens]
MGVPSCCLLELVTWASPEVAGRLRPGSLPASVPTASRKPLDDRWVCAGPLERSSPVGYEGPLAAWAVTITGLVRGWHDE